MCQAVFPDCKFDFPNRRSSRPSHNTPRSRDDEEEHEPQPEYGESRQGRRRRPQTAPQCAATALVALLPVVLFLAVRLPADLVQLCATRGRLRRDGGKTMIAIKDTLNEEEEEAVGAIARGGMQRPHRVGAVDLITGSCRVPGSGAAPTTVVLPLQHLALIRARQ